MKDKSWKQVTGGRSERIIISTIIILMLLVILDEILDLPYLLLRASRTPLNWTEIVIDILAFFVIGLTAIVLIRQAESKRKKMEEVLRESEESFRDLFENANDLIQSVDANGKFVYVNKKWLETLGYSKEELGRLKLTDILREDQIPHCMEIFIKVCSSESFENVETVFVSKGGREIVVEGNVSAKIKDGKSIATRCIFRDVTERKKAEKKIRRQNEFLNTIIESLAHPFYVIDANDYTIKMANPVARLGSLSEDSTCFALTHKRNKPCGSAEHICPLEEVKKTKKPVIVEHIHYDKDGNARNVEVHGFPILDNDANVVQMIEYCLDITQRKQAEEALRESEERFRSMTSAAKDAIIMIADKGQISLWNPASEKTFGHKREEAVGKDAANLLFPARLAEEYSERIKTFGQTGNDPFVGKTVEFVSVRKNGEEFPTELSLSALKIKDRWHSVGIVRDITERKRAQEALQRKADEQEQLLKTARHLTATLDLKEVLTRIGTGAKEILKAHGCAIYILESDGKTLKPVVALEPPYNQEILATPLNVDTSFTGRAVKAKKSLIFNNAGGDTSGQHIPGTPEEENENIITSPFIVDDKILGAMCLNRLDVLFSEEDLALAETFATYAATALKNAQTHDDLKREIDDRRKAEEALRFQSEIAVNMSEGVYVVRTSDGIIVYTNPKFEEIFGYTPGEMIGKHVSIVNAPTDKTPEETAKEIMGFLNKQGYWRGEIENIKRDGTPFWCYASVSVFDHPEHGKVWVVVHTDITERKKTEEQLEHLNSVLRAIRNVNQLITKEKDRKRLLKGACNNLVETRGYHNAWIALLDESRRLVMTAETRVGKDFLLVVKRLKRGELINCAQRALMQSGILTIKDPYSSCGDCPLSKNYAGRGAMSVRLEYGGKLYGLLSVSVPTQFTADKEEKTLFQEVADDISFALHNIELEEGRKRAEEALRESEEKYRTLVETAQEGIGITDPDENMTFVNQAFADLLGYTKEEALELNLKNITDKEGSAKLEKETERRRKGESSRYEIKLYTKTGQPRYFSVSATPILDENGAFAGSLGMLNDITDRQMAEEALKESEEKFRNLAEESPNMIFINQRGEVVYANKKCVEVMGYKREEFYSPDFDFVTLIAPESRDLVEARFSNHRKSEEVPPYEYALVTKEGTKIDAILATRLINYEGERAILGIVTDITERKKLQLQLIQSEKLVAVGTLAYGIAHEFNNILAGMMANAEYGLITNDSQEIKECFETIVENSKRASSITNNLLVFTREKEAKRELADITRPLRSVLAITRRELEKANIRIVDKISPVPMIFCDPGQFSEVFLNMITNARDAMRPDGGVLTIRVESQNDNIRIIFKDTGCGIPDYIKGRIFEPFVTTKGALGKSEVPGTGLGLFLTYGIVDGYHGKIEVESKAGEGTEFTILIPISKNLPRKPIMDTVIEPSREIQAKLKILLVDDEKPICITTKRFLESKGHAVTTSLRAKEGLSHFRREKFDLVLSDITMPDMDGIELIKRIRKKDEKAKIIVMTGHILKQKEEQARDAGANEVLVKPFKNDLLYQTIAKIIL